PRTDVVQRGRPNVRGKCGDLAATIVCAGHGTFDIGGTRVTGHTDRGAVTRVVYLERVFGGDCFAVDPVRPYGAHRTSSCCFAAQLTGPPGHRHVPDWRSTAVEPRQSGTSCWCARLLGRVAPCPQTADRIRRNTLAGGIHNPAVCSIQS